MRGVASLDYRIILYALLHDIGKPILRFSKRYLEGIEQGRLADEVKDMVTSFLGLDIEAIEKKRHDEISEHIIKTILRSSPSPDVKKIIEAIISEVDRLAASERGLGFSPSLSDFIKNSWRIFEEKITGDLRMPFNHYITPYLSPLWILGVTDYLKYIGPKSLSNGVRGGWGEHALGEFVNIFNRLIEAIDRGDQNAFINEMLRLVSSLKDEEYWLPVKTIIPRNIIELKAAALKEVAGKNNYAEVVVLLLGMLSRVKSIYSGLTRGYIDTILDVLRATTLLVPSAVYWSLVPDISLYSHSKLIAAYAAVRQTSDKSRFIVIDANGIQRFISAPVSAAAASRAMRGRSLLVELALDSLSNYVLEVFGGLPSTNILVSEGGALDILVPDIGNLDAKVSDVRLVAEEMSTLFNRALGFTIVYSQPFEISEGRFDKTVKAYASGGGTEFLRALESLKHNLTLEKARRGCSDFLVERSGIIAREDRVKSFDAITKEPVLADEKYSLCIGASNKGYADAIAGADKLEEGDCISTATHLSLIAGTVARRLSAIIALYTYGPGNGSPKPSSEFISLATLKLTEKICGRGDVLLCKLSGEEVETLVGLIPLPPGGSLYIGISSPIETNIYDVEEPSHIEATINSVRTVLDALAGVINEVQKDFPNASIRVSIIFVNAPHFFIASRALAKIYSEKAEGFEAVASRFVSIEEGVKKLLAQGVDVSMRFALMSSYHPARYVAAGGERSGFEHVDLDEYEIIAVGKLDFDLFGEVRKLMSFSPSRLITLSDLVNTIVAGKAYMYVIVESRRLKDRLVDVIPLYAGGDDVSIYGKWSHVVKYIFDVYSDIRSVLKPLTISAAISTGRSKTPILLLYKRVVELLEEYAKEARASLVIDEPMAAIYKCGIGEYCVSRALPLEAPSKYYPWFEDYVAGWNLETYSRLVDPLDVGKYGKLLDLSEFKAYLFELSTLTGELLRIVGGEHYKSSPLERIIPQQDRLLTLSVYYAYLWSRNGEKLKKLKSLLAEATNGQAMILAYPDDIVGKTSVSEALRVLLGAKTFIDLLTLALRRMETVEPTHFYS